MTQLQLETAMPLIPVKTDTTTGLDIWHGSNDSGGQIWSLPDSTWIMLQPLVWDVYTVPPLVGRLRHVLSEADIHTTRLSDDLLERLRKITGIRHRRVNWIRASALVEYFETRKRKLKRGFEVVGFIKQWLATKGQPDNVLTLQPRTQTDDIEDEDIAGVKLIISQLDALPEDVRMLDGIRQERQTAAKRLAELEATKAMGRHHDAHLRQLRLVRKQYQTYKLALSHAINDRVKAEETDKAVKIVPSWGHGADHKTCAQVAQWASRKHGSEWTYQAVDRAIRRIEKQSGIDLHLTDRQRQETWVDDQGIGRPKTVQLYSHAQARIILAQLIACAGAKSK